MATIKIGGKVSDMFDARIYDDNGVKILDYDGYVPDIPGIGGGDYINITIDLETGKIEDWEPMTAEEAKVAIVGEEEDEDDEDE